MTELLTPSGRKLPEQIGGYKVIARLSRGGMGEVLLGQKETHGFNKKVAIKVVLPHVAEDEEFRTLFFDEAKLMARMSHAHVAHVFDFGIDHEHLFMVMEYVDGPSVEALFRSHQRQGTRMPPELAALIIAQAARGLHSAHTLTDDEGRPLGVVHRDVSPQNLIVTYSGNTKVLDFGIARSNVRSGQTQVGVVRGKPGYMAPEQAKNRPLDARTDIFQLGIVFYELLTTRELYVRDNMYEAIAAAVEEPVPDVTQILEGVDPGFQDVLSAALAKDPDQRFTTADAMARALDAVISRCGHPVSEAALGDHVKALRPPAGDRSAETSSVPRTTEPLGDGRAQGQSTVELDAPDQVAAAAAAALAPPDAQAAQPQMKTISAAQASRRTQGIETPTTRAVAAPPDRRRVALAAGGAVGIVLALLIGWALWASSRDVPPPLEDLDPPVPVEGADPEGAPPSDVPTDAGTRPANEASMDAPPPPEPEKKPARRRRRTRRAEAKPSSTSEAPAARPETPSSPAPTPATPAPSSTTPPGGAEGEGPAGQVVKKAKGSIFVVSDPYAQIFVDGKQRGDTPKLLRLVVGERQIRLVDPQNGEAWWSQTVTIVDGKNPQIKAKR